MDIVIKRERLRPVLFFLSGLFLAIIFFLLINLIGHEVIISGAGQTQGLKIGTAFPEFSFPDLSGRMVSLKEYRSKNTLVMFVKPACGSCKELLPVVRDFASKKASRINLVIISSGADSANIALAKEYKLSCPVLKADRKLFDQRYKVTEVPFFYLIDKEGVLKGKQVGMPPDLAKIVLEGIIKKVK